MALKLENEQEVTINVPFTYIIGEVGTYTNKILKTVEDCKAEVLAEIENGIDGEIFMTVAGE